MDVALPSSTASALDPTVAQSTQAVQVSVLKKAMQAQASEVLGLLQAVAPVPTTGELPLATSGTLGTQLNALV